MKFFNLLIFLVLFCEFSISQSSLDNSKTYNNLDSLKVELLKYSTQPWINHTPGQEMRAYAKSHYTGVSLGLAGGSLIALGTIVNYEYRTNNPNFGPGLFGIPGGYTMMGAGILTTLIGTVFLIEAPIHLKRAGVIMDHRGVGVSIKL